MPYHTKTNKAFDDDFEIDEELDMLFLPEGDNKKVYAVPRIRKCISSCFIHLLNTFGNQGGFETFEHVLS